MEFKYNQSYWWYAPISLVLISGYLLGASLAFGVTFLGWLPDITSLSGRYAASLFGMGMLGATLYAQQWWARDMDEALLKPQFLPHFFDAAGYLMTIFAGGVTGIIFYLLVRFTSSAVLNAGNAVGVKTSAGFFIAFCGGMAQYKIHPILSEFATKLLRQEKQEHKSAAGSVQASSPPAPPNPTDPTNTPAAKNPPTPPNPTAPANTPAAKNSPAPPNPAPTNSPAAGTTDLDPKSAPSD